MEALAADVLDAIFVFDIMRMLMGERAPEACKQETTTKPEATRDGHLNLSNGFGAGHQPKEAAEHTIVSDNVAQNCNERSP